MFMLAEILDCIEGNWKKVLFSFYSARGRWGDPSRVKCWRRDCSIFKPDAHLRFSWDANFCSRKHFPWIRWSGWFFV